MALSLPQYPVKILFNRAAQFHSVMNVLGKRKREFVPHIHCVWLVLLSSTVDGVKGQTIWLLSEKCTQLFICLFIGSSKRAWFGSDSVVLGNTKA